MTLVYKVALPGHRTRSKEDDMFLVEEGGTGRLLYFQKSHDSRKIKIPMVCPVHSSDLKLFTALFFSMKGNSRVQQSNGLIGILS